MKKKKAIIVNLIIIAVSLLVYMAVTGGAFTPMGAHKKQERTIHYGPSEIVAVVEKENSRFILGKFNGYYSCSTVERGFLGLWYGNGRWGMWGTEIDYEKPLNANQFAFHQEDIGFDKIYVYGVINDKDTKSIEIDVLIEDKDEKVQTVGVKISDSDGIFDDMFFGVIEGENMMHLLSQKRIAAFSKDGELFYEEIDPKASYYEERQGK